MTTTPGPQLVPIAIGSYEDTDYPPLEADAEVKKVIKLLADFHPQVLPWDDVPQERRSLDAVSARLMAWSGQPDGGDTILYWVGHGWSNDVAAALAAQNSPANGAAGAISPAALAEYLSRRPDHGTGWTFAIFDTCRSTRFVELLAAELHRDPYGARRVLLLGVSGDGFTQLGRFRNALARTLRNTFQGLPEIRLWELGSELARDLGGNSIAVRLNDERLTRRVPVPPGATPLDVAAELREVLATLPADEQRHFVPKGQGAEQGELAWYFQGREDEQRHISDWLRGHDHGLLAVTGRPGSGKSALLGHVLTQSRPALRRTLARHNLLPVAPADQRPDDDTFDTTLLLTGLTPADVVAAIAADTGLDTPPAGDSITAQVDWLIERIGARASAAGRPLTLLVDALDEAQQPLTIADQVLRRLAAVPGVRVVAGTRRSTREGPDLPEPPDTDLLDALRRGRQQEPARYDELTVGRDPTAIARYVRRRLASALPGLDPDTVLDVATDIGARTGNEFLFARLAVHEMIARPDLLTGPADDELRILLAGDHQKLFAAALTRLAGQAPARRTLLRALAFARGRGAPIRDEIWATIATGLDPDRTIAPEQIEELLEQAAPYLMYDIEDGQTVYRLAHRTFQEHFLDQLDEPATARDHHAVLAALLDRVTTDRPLNPYLARHLSGHAAAAGMPGWRALADRPDVLDILDQAALGVDAIRHGFGHPDLPPQIAGVIGAQPDLAAAALADRHGLRQLAMARRTGTRTFPRTDHALPAWSVRSARLRQHPLHATFTGHTKLVGAVAAFTSADGRTLLATGSADRTVRVWDPTTGAPVGEPLTGHTDTVTEVAAFTGMDGQPLLATGSADRTVRIWDPTARTPVGELLTGHTDRVTVIAGFTSADGKPQLATGSRDGTVRIWDPITSTPIGRPLTGHNVTAVAAFTGMDGRPLLATGSADRAVRIWDPITRTPVGEPFTGHSAVKAIAGFTGVDGRPLLATSWDGAVRIWDPTTRTPVGDLDTGWMWAVAGFTGGDGRPLLGVSGMDGTLRVWDLITGTPIGDPLTGPTGVAIAGFTGIDGRPLLATGSRDGTVRVWDPTTGTPIGDPLTGHSEVEAIAGFTGVDGRPLLATGGAPQTVRIWDPTTGTPARDPLKVPPGPVVAVAGFTGIDGRPLLATGSPDGTVRVWDPTTGTPVGYPFTGHTRGLSGMAGFTGTDGRPLLATCGGDGIVRTNGGGYGTVRIWDPTTCTPVGGPLTGHTGKVVAVAAFTGLDGRPFLASGGADGTVRVWDPTTGTPIGDPLTGHTLEVRAVAAFTGSQGKPLLATGSADGTVRVWDPTTGTPIGDPLTGHTDWVEAVTTFTGGDGRPLLATGSRDRTVRLWDPTTRRLVHAIPVGASIRALCPVDGGIAIRCDDGLLVIDLLS